MADTPSDPTPVTVAVPGAPRKASGPRRLLLAVVVIESLPLGQPPPQVHVVREAQELVELLMIRAVRAIHLAIELPGGHSGPGYPLPPAARSFFAAPRLTGRSRFAVKTRPSSSR